MRVNEEGDVVDVEAATPGEVQAVDGKWLWLAVHDGAGWIAQECVVPVDQRGVVRVSEMIEHSLDSPTLYLVRGIIRTQIGELDKAIDDFDEALKLDPRSAVIWKNRGIAWISKSDNDKALEDLDNAIRLNSNDAKSFYCRGVVWDDKSELDRAFADYSEAIRLDPLFQYAYHNRGNILNLRGEYDLAIADFNEAIRINPDDVMAFNNRGNSWIEKQDYDKAIEDYSAAIGLAPDLRDPHHNRGNVWYSKAEYDKAIADYSEAIQIDPNDAVSYENRGAARSNMGEFNLAFEDLDMARHIDPENAGRYQKRIAMVYASRAFRLKLSGEYEQAIADYNEAIRLDPDSEEVCFRFARLLATCPDQHLRDGHKAVKLATKACALSDWQNDSFIETLSAAQATAGEYHLAIETIERAIQLKPSWNKAAREEMLSLYRVGKPYILETSDSANDDIR